MDFRYEIATKFGKIDKKVTDAELMPLPQSVKYIETKTLSIREAARLFSGRGRDYLTCNCKTGCRTNHCPCRRNNNVSGCTTACHQGRRCKNQQNDNDVSEPVVEILGGCSGTKNVIVIDNDNFDED